MEMLQFYIFNPVLSCVCMMGILHEISQGIECNLWFSCTGTLETRSHSLCVWWGEGGSEQLNTLNIHIGVFTK